jgi:hypothetical protein
VTAPVITPTTEGMEPGGDQWSITATASKIAAMMGMSEWDSMKSIWLKMKYPNAFKDSTNAAQQRGTDLEEVFLNIWFRNNPRYRRLSAGEVTIMCATLGFPAAATPDCLAEDTETGEIICVEHKTVGRFADMSLWGTPGSDVAPDGYVLQCIWQMICSGYLRTALVRSGPCLDDQETYWVHANADVHAMVIEKVAAFMQSLVDDLEPPNDDRVETYDAIRTVFQQIDRKENEDWEVSPDAAIDYTLALEAFDQAEGRLLHAKSDMLKIMGPSRRAVITLPPKKGKRGQDLKPEVLVVCTRKPVRNGGVSLTRPRTPLNVFELQALRETVQVAA